MTIYFIGSSTTVASGNAFNLSNSDSVFIDSNGELVSTDPNGDGLFVGSTSANNSITSDGTIYGGYDGIQCDAANSPVGSATTISINGSVYGGTNDGIDSSGGNSNCDISVGAKGNVQGAIFGVSLEGGDAKVLNGGTISGTTGIYIDGSNCSIVNTGLITATTEAFELSGRGTSITNTGTITEDGNNAFVIDDGTGTFISNSGIIMGGIAGDASSDPEFTIDNSGTWDAFESGLNFNAEGVSLTNSGKIIGDITTGAIGNVDVENAGTIVGAVDLDEGGAITNSGLIYGSIVLQGAIGSLNNLGSVIGDVSITNGLGSTGMLDNAGSVHGDITVQGQVAVTNTGTIHGNITLIADSGTDTVTNGGLIHGTVTLGADNNVVNTGLIQGAVTMGTSDNFNTGVGSVTGIMTATTSDTFDFSGNFGHYKIADFATSGATHDILSFASDDFSSYTELQSHMAQVGNDVVITLDASDDIILLHTKLTVLIARDFAFT